MKTVVLDVARRNLVWLMAIVAAFGTAVDALVAAFSGMMFEFWIRSGATVLLFLVAALVENVKVSREN